MGDLADDRGRLLRSAVGYLPSDRNTRMTDQGRARPLSEVRREYIEHQRTHEGEAEEVAE